MIITLKGADFSTNNINDLLNSYSISYYGNGVSGTPSSRSKDDAGDLTCTLTIADGYTYQSLSVSVGGITLSSSDYEVVEKSDVIQVIVGETAITGNIMISVVTEGSGTVEPEPSDTYTFTINPTPTTATVTLTASGYSTVSGTGSKSITVVNGTKVNWSVSADGYVSQEGVYDVARDYSMNIELAEDENSEYTLTINTVPSSGISVFLTPSGGDTITANTVTVPKDTYVAWSLFKTGGHRVSGRILMDKNITKEIAYDPTGTFTDPNTLKTFDEALFQNGSFIYSAYSVYANNKKRVISATTQYTDKDICLAEIDPAYQVEVLFYEDASATKYHSRIEMIGNSLLPKTIVAGSYYRLHIKLANESGAAEVADIPTFVNALKYYI